MCDWLISPQFIRKDVLRLQFTGIFFLLGRGLNEVEKSFPLWRPIEMINISL